MRRAPLYALYARGRDLLVGQCRGAGGDPLVRPDDDGERGADGPRRVLQLPADRARGVLRRSRRRPPRVQSDERGRGSRQLRRRRRDPAAALDGRARALATHDARLRRRTSGRARRHGAGSALPRCRRDGRGADGARQRHPRGNPAGLHARGRAARRRARGDARGDGRPLARCGQLPVLGCARGPLRAAATRHRRDGGARPVLRGAGGGNAVHLGSAAHARPRRDGAAHEPDRGAGLGGPDRLRTGEVRQRHRSRPDARGPRRDGARGRARLQRDRTPASTTSHVPLLLRLRAGGLPRAGDRAVAAGRPRALAVAGFAAGPINPLLFTVQTEIVPSHLRGRVFGAVRAGAWAAIPLGILLGSAAVAVAGVAVTFLAMGVLLAAVVGYGYFNPAFREMDR